MNEFKQRKALELEINRAADGKLSFTELADLELRLKNHPDLYETYQRIMSLPDLSEIYKSESDEYLRSGLNSLLTMIEEDGKSFLNFADTTLYWFKRYALAASIAIVAVTSGVYLNQQGESNEPDLSVEQLLYPEEGGEAETYVLYLEELFDE